MIGLVSVGRAQAPGLLDNILSDLGVTYLLRESPRDRSFCPISVSIPGEEMRPGATNGILGKATEGDTLLGPWILESDRISLTFTRIKSLN